MNTVSIKRRSFLRPVAATLCVAVLSGAAAASEHGTAAQERVGLFSGMLLGAAVGGPPGAVIGAIGGGVGGRSYGRERSLDRQAAEIARLRTELEQAQVRAAARSEAPPAVATVASTAPVELNLWQPREALETSVQFRTGSAELEPHFAQQLRHLAAFANELPHAVVRLAGYADPRGEAPENLKLSSARVRAVRDALMAEGVEDDRITSDAFGESRPLYADDDREGRGFERRVLIRIDTEEPQS